LVIRLRVLKQGGGDVDDDEEGEEGGTEEYEFLKKVEATLLPDLTLKGIPGIKKVFMREQKVTKYEEESGEFKSSNEWLLDTEGCNLRDVLVVPEVDPRKVTSNDVVEIFETLGIEAARQALLNELRAVISFDGSYVNYRHMALLCDTMCHRGHLMAITRHGINRGGRGPLMRCSFEEMVDMLTDAATYAETDNLNGVSENIVLGNVSSGTFILLHFPSARPRGHGRHGLVGGLLQA
jgi:DNA-directed RNA polymerase II subunit RPB1